MRLIKRKNRIEKRDCLSAKMFELFLDRSAFFREIESKRYYRPTWRRK